MKPRIALSTKILLLAFANLVLLGLVAAAFARFGLGIQFDSRLVGPARERVVSVGRQVALDLQDTPVAGRDALLGRYSAQYGVRFYLFGQPGQRQLAGPAVSLPEPVLAELRRPPPRASGPPGRRGRGGRGRGKGRGGDRDGRGPGPDGPGPDGPGRDGPGRDGPGRDGPGRDGPGRDGPGPEETGEEGRGSRKALGPERDSPVFEVSTREPSLFWAGVGIPLREPEGEEQQAAVVLMSAPSFISTPLFFDYKPWLWLSGALIAVFLLCWLPFIRGLTKAVREMSKATEQIAEGRFDQHLAGERADELGLLAGSINTMAGRLSGFVTGQKRFLGDIAHELCAPIARIQFALGILERKTEPGATDDLQEEMKQMSALVAELLSFSKAGMQQDGKALIAVPVEEPVRQAVAREAGPTGPDVQLDIEPGLRVLADTEAVTRAVSNLVRNAIRYAGDCGPITVRVKRERSEVLIVVSDCGPGLPEAEVDRVFAPFYRLENSRNRASGGVGLGLAIVRNCVEACKGTVRCRNRVPTGLEVEIRLQSAD